MFDRISDRVRNSSGKTKLCFELRPDLSRQTLPSFFYRLIRKSKGKRGKQKCNEIVFGRWSIRKRTKRSVRERHRKLIRITGSWIILQSSILESLKATDEEKAWRSFEKPTTLPKRSALIEIFRSTKTLTVELGIEYANIFRSTREEGAWGGASFS